MGYGSSRGHVHPFDKGPVTQVDEISSRNSSANVGAHLVAYIGVAIDDLETQRQHDN